MIFVLVLACVCPAGEARLAPENPGGPAIFEVPGLAPAPRTEHGFKNADPAYSRASYVERLRSLIWSKRTGPFGGLIGVERVTPPPVKLEDLPPIDFVLISHDHYDHLDEATVRQLAHVFNPVFVVPMAIKAWPARALWCPGCAADLGPGHAGRGPAVGAQRLHASARRHPAKGGPGDGAAGVSLVRQR